MEFLVRLKNPLVLIAVLLTQIVMLAVQVRRQPSPGEPDSPSMRLLRVWGESAVAPFERFSTYSGHGIRAAWANYVALRHVRDENKELRDQIAALRLEQVALSEDALEGKRLQHLLEFRQQYVSTTVAAQVIGTSGSDRSRLLLLDKGADAGLKPDMAVMTPDGVVGKLRDVFSHTSQLLLLSDSSAGAGVMLESSRIRAILRGSTDGRVIINSLTADNRIKVGDRVLTSGGDQVFPRGLPVGTIESIKPDPDHQPYTLITLQTAAKLTQLEEVLVITATQSDLSPQAQHDLETAAEAKRAADIVAERLPSLHPDTPATNPDGTPVTPGTTTPADAANPGGTIPHPLPTEHPDRFTPGTTPPAAELQPGAKHGPVSVPVPVTPAPSKPAPATVPPEVQ